MKTKTGHRQTKDFQDQKALIKQFAKDHGCEVNETANTLIVTRGGMAIEMKPKISEYRDVQTNKSYPYFNATACLMGLFDCYKQH